jgi:hypothetical protein
VTRTLAILTTLLAAGLAPAGEPGEPPLELVSRLELEGPLTVELQEAPVLLGGAEEFRAIRRDPRFPSVLLRRHGAVYAAFRKAGPIPTGQHADPVPSDAVFFVGRPSVEEIRRIWPDAIVERASEPEPVRATPVAHRPTVSVPRMAHQPSRVRRLAALAAKYAPAE